MFNYVGQNGNSLKTDKNGNRTEIKRKRNGNGTGLSVPLYGREMGTFFDAYRTSADRSYYIPSAVSRDLPKRTVLVYIHPVSAKWLIADFQKQLLINCPTQIYIERSKTTLINYLIQQCACIHGMHYLEQVAFLALGGGIVIFTSFRLRISRTRL